MSTEHLTPNPKPPRPIPSSAYWLRGLVFLGLCFLGILVNWSYHAWELPYFLFSFLAAAMVSFVAGGLIGIPLMASLAPLVSCAGMLEGIRQGWAQMGFWGSLLGGLLGFLASNLILAIPVMLIHLSLVLLGIQWPGDPGGVTNSGKR